MSYDGRETLWMAKVGEHLIQAFYSSVIGYSRLPRIMSGWVLRMYTEGNPSAFQKNLFQCSAIVIESFFFLCLIRISIFQFVATGHLWEEFISFFFIPPISYFYTFIMFPWTLFSPAWIVPSLHSYGSYSSPSIFNPVCWIHSTLGLSFHTSLVWLGSALQMCLTSLEAEVKDHLLQSAGNTLIKGCHSYMFTLFGSFYWFVCCKDVPTAEVFSIN